MLRPVLYPKVPDVYVTRLLTCQHSSVCFQLHCALIVLSQYAFLHLVALLLEEHVHPYNVWHIVARSNNLGLG